MKRIRCLRLPVLMQLAVAYALLFGICWTLPADDSAGAKDHAPGEHAGAQHGSEFDLSHANAGPQQEAPEEIKSDMSIYTFVVFVLLTIVLLKFAWVPIMAGLSKREESIARMIEDARQSARKAEQTLAEYQRKLAAAQEETREMLTRTRQEADALKERIVAEAQAAAEREKERAVADIRSARDVALQEIAQRSVDTAVQLAAQIVRREVKPAEHTQLIRDALERFPNKN
jgi:F-type H+-transporting ATPase subunit b